MIAYNICVLASLCAYSPCNPWFSIHSSTNDRSLDPLSVLYKSGNGVKIAVDSFGIRLDVVGSERCEIARCKAADGGGEPVISADVKEGSSREYSGGRIERAITTSGKGEGGRGGSKGEYEYTERPLSFIRANQKIAITVAHFALPL